MNKPTFHINQYDVALEPQLRQLEKESTQGKFVQLEMIRSGFLSRSVVFEKYQPYIAINDQEQVIGTAIGAIVPLRINEKTMMAGYGFDVKVSPKFRNQRVAQMLAKHTINNFFVPNKLGFHFITLKKTNSPVISLTSHVVKNIFLYDFAYLTIPTHKRVLHISPKGQQHFFVSLLSNNNKLQPYYTLDESGLGVWWLDKLYKIKIMHIHPLIKAGMWFRKHMGSQTFAYPQEGNELTSAMLFNHTSHNIHHINSILVKLQEKGIHYLMVCCQPKDGIYQSLKAISINTYGYYLLCNQKIHKSDTVSLDVRCL